MPTVILRHDGCEPWVNLFRTDAEAERFAAAWAERGWSRTGNPTPTPAPAPAPAAPAPVAPPAAPAAPVDVPAEPATPDPAPAVVTNPEGN
jgi:hypothetical protein